MNQPIQKQVSREVDPEAQGSRRPARQAQFTDSADDSKGKSQSVAPPGQAFVPAKDQKKHPAGPVSQRSADKKDRLENPETHSFEDHRAESHPAEREDPEAARRFQKYLQSTGISLAFQLIFAEVLQKKIAKDKVLGYTSQRLKQIGADLQELKDRRL